VVPPPGARFPRPGSFEAHPSNPQGRNPPRDAGGKAGIASEQPARRPLGLLPGILTRRDAGGGVATPFGPWVRWPLNVRRSAVKWRGKPGDDAVLVGNSKYDVKNKVNQFAQLLKLDKTKARTEADKNLLKILDKFELDEGKIIPYNYRPFDTGFTYYDKEIYTRAVFKIKEQFDKENICLLATKIVTSHPFQHAFISEIFPDVIFVSSIIFKGYSSKSVNPTCSPTCREVRFLSLRDIAFSNVFAKKWFSVIL